ncbi:unnamed protein product [Blepharisma stoltei]|uniref:succinate dehydrogenase n=1 Tax=Blepharisma stoltei TaxID=1481888 RepID=A0AAU9IYI1_9CILI|nr:unnamed protein product [Blepharisma stoltei]
MVAHIFKSLSRKFSDKSPGLLSDFRFVLHGLAAGNKAYLFQEESQIDRSTMTELHIHRFLPESGKGQFVQSYWIDMKECGPMVLDALIKIKNEIDPTLTFRRSCREGICGSCSMHINGINTLACICPMEPKVRVTVGPLIRYPIIKDLVVDMTHFYNQYKSIDPWLKRKNAKEPGSKEYYQSPNDRRKLDGLYECILCACCSTLCPSYWWNQQMYLGPAVLLQAYRWVIDSRDEAIEERLENLSGDFKLAKCYQIGTCTVTCPKKLDPKMAIYNLRAIYNEYEDSKKNWDI